MGPLSTMKRKDLQKLAKKYNIKANAKNEDIIRELSQILGADSSEMDDIMDTEITSSQENNIPPSTAEPASETPKAELPATHEHSQEPAEAPAQPLSPIQEEPITSSLPQNEVQETQPSILEEPAQPSSPQDVQEPQPPTQEEPAPPSSSQDGAQEPQAPIQEEPAQPSSSQGDAQEPQEEPAQPLTHEDEPAPSSTDEDKPVPSQEGTQTQTPSLYPILSPLAEKNKVNFEISPPSSPLDVIPLYPVLSPLPESITKPTVEQLDMMDIQPSMPAVVADNNVGSAKTAAKETKMAELAKKDDRVTTRSGAKLAKTDSNNRRENVIQSKKLARAEAVQDRQKTKKTALAAVGNRVSGANRPTAPKVKPSKETAAKAITIQKAKENIKKKRIDFDKLHEKQFNTMTSIADHQKSKDNRAFEFLFGFPKPGQTPATNSVPASETPSAAASEPSAPSTSDSAPPTSEANTVVPAPAAKPKGFSFKPPESKSTKNSARTPSKSSTSTIAKTPKSAVRPSLASKATPVAVNRIISDAKQNTITVPSFVAPPALSVPPPTISAPTPTPTPIISHFAANSTTSVFLNIKDNKEGSKTPRALRPRPLLSEGSRTPLKPVTETKPPVSAKRAKPAASTASSTEGQASSSSSSASSTSSTSAPTASSSTDTKPTSNLPKSPAAEPPTKRAKGEKPYVPHVGPLPKFENTFSSFYTPAKAAPKPKYDPKKSIASAKKTPKRAAATNNKENSANNSINSSMAC